MVFSIILILVICILLVIVNSMLRRLKAQKLVPRYLVAPAPKAKAVGHFRSASVMISLVVVAALAIYLFESHEIDLSSEQDIAPDSPAMVESELEVSPSKVSEEPPDELAGFEFGP